MFRKYYKDANNEIKPSGEFVNNVIDNAVKRRPPYYARYVRGVAAAAAAVIIISATVFSVPMLRRVNDKNDFDAVPISPSETTSPITEPSVASVPPQPHGGDGNAPAPTAVTETDGGAKRSESSMPSKSTAAASEKGGGTDITAPERESENVPARKSSAVLPPAETDNVSEADTQADAAAPAMGENSFTESDAADTELVMPFSVGNRGGGGSPSVSSSFLNDYYDSECDDVYHDYSLPYNAIIGSDIPAPEGYSREYSSDTYSRFTSEDGASIDVSVKHSGADDEDASYTESDGIIEASLSSGGASVEIYAQGADKESVDEIVNYFTGETQND